MQLIASYKNPSSSSISLDTICNSATYFVGKWNPDLKRNQSRDALTLIISKLYGSSHGSLFKSRIRSSQEALASTLDLSREWTCKLIARLRESKWITTEAPRLPDGTQEITTFRPGKMLKRLLVMLLKSKQRSQNRVNDQSQKIPTKEERERSKALFGGLIEELAKKLGRKT
jgi:hypothetical protein